MNGFICINKPAGMTSNDVVMNVRRFTGEKKTGHAGTLDPNACGLLTVAVGKASRLIEYLDEAPKIYRCRAILGLATDTHDVWGTPVKDIRGTFDIPSEVQVEEALNNLEGIITQTPSKYSALKENGKRLYELARAGVDVKVKERQIAVFWTSLIDFDAETGEVFFDVCCSKGTYIRTLCDALGEKLGCGCAMKFLLRLQASGFSLEDSYTLDQLSQMDQAEIEELLIPAEKAVSSMPRCELNSGIRAERFLNGLEFSSSQCFFSGMQPIPGCPVGVFYNDIFLGVASAAIKGGTFVFSADKVFK